METKLIGRVRDLVKPQYDWLECWAHSWKHHTRRVSEFAEKLAEMEKIDPLLSIIASYCHDLGRIEEEKRKKRGEAPVHHAILSIEPTATVLKKVGISGSEFGEIIEAVTVHSYKTYDGKNTAAKILRDADKIHIFCPHGVLSNIKFFTGNDYVDPTNITLYLNDPVKLEKLCEEAIQRVEPQSLNKALNGLNFAIEWYDMFHYSESSHAIIGGGYEYLKRTRETLSARFRFVI